MCRPFATTAFAQLRTSTQFATRSGRDLLGPGWNYHDDDLPAEAAQVSLTIDGARIGRPEVTEYRVDRRARQLLQSVEGDGFAAASRSPRSSTRS